MSAASEYRARVQVRWRDLDRLGHLNQAVYHEFLEEARAGLMTDHGEVETIARIGHVGTTSVRIDHDIVLPDGAIAATGCTVLVAWDREARGKRAVTDAERAALLSVTVAP